MPGRDNAAPRQGGRADRAVATQRAARIHRDVGDDRTVDRQRTAVHRRRAGVAAVAGEVQRTAAGLGAAAAALAFVGEFAFAFLIDGQSVCADVYVRSLAAPNATTSRGEQ